MKVTYDHTLKYTTYTINDIHEFPKIFLTELTNRPYSIIIKHLNSYKIIVFKSRKQFVVYINGQSIMIYVPDNEMLKCFIVIYNLLLCYHNDIITLEGFINEYNKTINKISK